MSRLQGKEIFQVEDVPLEAIIRMINKGDVYALEEKKYYSLFKSGYEAPKEFEEETLIARTKDGRTYRAHIIKDNVRGEISQAPMTQVEDEFSPVPVYTRENAQTRFSPVPVYTRETPQLPGLWENLQYSPQTNFSPVPVYTQAKDQVQRFLNSLKGMTAW